MGSLHFLTESLYLHAPLKSPTSGVLQAPYESFNLDRPELVWCLSVTASVVGTEKGTALPLALPA